MMGKPQSRLPHVKPSTNPHTHPIRLMGFGISLDGVVSVPG